MLAINTGNHCQNQWIAAPEYNNKLEYNNEQYQRNTLTHVGNIYWTACIAQIYTCYNQSLFMCKLDKNAPEMIVQIKRKDETS